MGARQPPQTARLSVLRPVPGGNPAALRFPVGACRRPARLTLPSLAQRCGARNGMKAAPPPRPSPFAPSRPRERQLEVSRPGELVSFDCFPRRAPLRHQGDRLAGHRHQCRLRLHLRRAAGGPWTPIAATEHAAPARAYRRQRDGVACSTEPWRDPPVLSARVGEVAAQQAEARAAIGSLASTLHDALSSVTFEIPRLGSVSATELRAIYRDRTPEEGFHPRSAQPLWEDDPRARVEDVLSTILAGDLEEGHVGSGFSYVTPSSVAMPLSEILDGAVRAAAILGPEETARAVDRWANEGTIRYQWCAILNGLSVDQDLDLDGNVRLHAVPGSLPEALSHLPVRTAFNFALTDVMRKLRGHHRLHGGTGLLPPQPTGRCPMARGGRARLGTRAGHGELRDNSVPSVVPGMQQPCGLGDAVERVRRGGAVRDALREGHPFPGG